MIFNLKKCKETLLGFPVYITESSFKIYLLRIKKRAKNMLRNYKLYGTTKR